MKIIFDTYALLEYYIFGNKAYDRYFVELKKQQGAVHKLILIEFYTAALRETNEEQAIFWYMQILGNFELLEITDNIIFDAGKIKLQSIKEKTNLSYSDCISLAFALIPGCAVLTGDQGFKNKENVIFVK